MKFIKELVTDTFITFAVLSLLLAVLIKAGVFEGMGFADTALILLLMAAATTLFVTLREHIFPKAGAAKHVIDIAGCSVIILICAKLAGWLELSFRYFLIIFAMVLAVYLLVWLLTWLQSKRDEEALNRLLARHDVSEKK